MPHGLVFLGRARVGREWKLWRSCHPCCLSSPTFLSVPPIHALWVSQIDCLLPQDGPGESSVSYVGGADACSFLPRGSSQHPHPIASAGRESDLGLLGVMRYGRWLLSAGKEGPISLSSFSVGCFSKLVSASISKHIQSPRVSQL